MFNKVLLICLLFLTLLFGNNITKEITPEHAVVDHKLNLSFQEKDMLQKQLANYNTKHKGQIAIIISNNLQNKTIKTRSKELFYQWIKDPKVRENSVLIFISPFIKKVQIQIGHEARKLLNDVALDSILHYQILLLLNSGKLYEGLHQGINTTIDVLEGKLFYSNPKEKKTIIFDKYQGLILYLLVISALVAFIWISFDKKAKFRWAVFLFLLVSLLVDLWITGAWMGLVAVALMVTFVMWLFNGDRKRGEQSDNCNIDCIIDEMIDDSNFDVYSGDSSEASIGDGG